MEYKSRLIYSITTSQHDLVPLDDASARMPAEASATPPQPINGSSWPLRKIDNNTEKIFRVVVTVVHTSGSKVEIV